jgi:hypothetical protein
MLLIIDISNSIDRTTTFVEAGLYDNDGVFFGRIHILGSTIEGLSGRAPVVGDKFDLSLSFREASPPEQGSS